MGWIIKPTREGGQLILASAETGLPIKTEKGSAPLPGHSRLATLLGDNVFRFPNSDPRTIGQT